MMLHVRAALSGNPVEELHVEELKVGLQETEELRVVALKRVLAAKLGCTRFRLKLLGGEAKVIADDAPLSSPADFTLVRMDFQSSDEATNATFISACKEGRVTELEGQLHCYTAHKTLMLEMHRTTATARAFIGLPGMATWLLYDCCWRLVLRMQNVNMV